MHEAPRLAVILSDKMPPAELGAALRLSGYDLDVVHTVDAAARLLNHTVPQLLVAGPFRGHPSGLDFLLRKMLELSVHVLLVSDAPDLIALAGELGVQVRTVGDPWAPHQVPAKLT